MKAICENDLVIDCEGYKAIESGVILMGDEERKEVIAFIPDGKLVYLLPDDVVELEHEKLGLPAPEIDSPGELESRLEQFVGEMDSLRESLDQQVADLIDEGATVEEEDVERRERIHERRRTIDRQLQQVRQRSQQLRQLSTAEEAEGAEVAEVAMAENGEAAGPTASTVDELRTEMDERFAAIESKLDQVAAATGTEAAEESDAAEAESAAADENLEGIKGLGSTYKKRLNDAGIETVGDLAEQSPEDVADAASTSKNRASEWIDRAKERLEAETVAA
ncbi:helix-hairpin-helix domain-containing protein [Haloarchaeobius sp. DFWS5]|uniref:helix-hairpin-helix domain-containing protein n=1 Tax=Haloarchaeobius sp. DFWS5 TaxID=3446114 RepID=UPI003EB7914C